MKQILNERPHKCYLFNHFRNLMAQRKKIKEKCTFLQLDFFHFISFDREYVGQTIRVKNGRGHRRSKRVKLVWSWRVCWNTSFVTLLRDTGSTGFSTFRSALLSSVSMIKLSQCRTAVSLLVFSVTEINFPFFCRSTIFFPVVFDAMFVILGTSQWWLTRDIMLSRYLRRLVAHKQLARTSLTSGEKGVKNWGVRGDSDPDIYDNSFSLLPK